MPLHPTNSGLPLPCPPQKERTADLTAKVLQELTGEEEQRPNLQSDRCVRGRPAAGAPRRNPLLLHI